MKKTLCLFLALALMLSATAAFAEVTRGGKVVMAKSNKLTNGMDLTHTNARDEDAYFMTLIYENLVTYDAEGNIAPMLAKSWEISEDGLTIKMNLRDDVFFHDGTKFNAEAVKVCFDWYRTPELAHAYALGDMATIESIEVADEYVVQFNMNQIDASLFSMLTTQSGYIASPKAIQEWGLEGFKTQTCGTGPFILKEYVENDHVTVSRNDNYYLMGEDGQKLPYLDEIELRIMIDDNVKLTNLLSGDIQVWDYQSSANSLVTAAATEGIESMIANLCEVFFLCFNLNDEKLADPRVRQAVYYAVNREELIDVIFEGFGDVYAFQSTPAQWFYSDYDPYKEYSPEKAKALLAEAGYPDGIELELSVIAREPDNTMCQLIQEQMKESNITIKLEALERLAWVDKIRTNRGGQLGVGKITIRGLDPCQQYLSVLQYIDPQYCQDLDQMRLDGAKVYDQTERKAIYDAFQKQHLDNAMKILLGQNPRYACFTNKLHGMTARLNGTLDFTYAWLEK